MPFVAAACLLLMIWIVALLRWLMRSAEPVAVPHVTFWKRHGAAAAEHRVVRRPPLPITLLFAATLVTVIAAGWSGGEHRSIRIQVASNISHEQIDEWLNALELRLREHSITPEVRWNADEPAAPPAILIGDAASTRPGIIAVHLAASPAVQLIRAGVATDPAQLMIELRNVRVAGDAEIHIAGTTDVLQRITLPPPGVRQTYFIDLPAIEPELQLSIRGSGPTAWQLAQTLHTANPPPALGIAPSAPAEISRFVAVYSRLHPPAHASLPIYLGDTLPSTQAGLIVPLFGTAMVKPSTVTSTPHPIVRHIDLQLLADGPIAIAAAPPPGWTVVARADGQPILAVADTPTRQAWLGFWSTSFASQDDFVVLLSDTIDWLNHGPQQACTIAPDPSPPLPDPQRLASACADETPSENRWLAPLCWCSMALLGCAGLVLVRQ